MLNIEIDCGYGYPSAKEISQEFVVAGSHLSEPCHNCADSVSAITTTNDGTTPYNDCLFVPSRTIDAVFDAFFSVREL